MKDNNSLIPLNLEVEQVKIGIRFRQLRKESGYTSSEKFANAHKLDRSQYGKIENGKFNLTLKVFIRVLNLHSMTFSDFFNEEYDSIIVGE